MSYWSHNTKLLDEIATGFLPEPWKTQVEDGEILLSNVPNDIWLSAMERIVGEAG